MSNIRRLLLFVLLSCPFVLANQAYTGYCSDGGKKIISVGILSTTTVMASYPGCTVTVNNLGGGLATIFSDNIGTPLANPFQASSITGQFTFYAANSRYTIILSGGTPLAFPSPVTITDVLLNDPAGTSITQAIVTANSFISSSANPSATGIFRASSSDSAFCFRNFGNTNDICIKKTGAATANQPANMIDLTGFGAVEAASFETSSLSPAVGGVLACSASDNCVNIRNQTNTADIVAIAKDSSDRVVVGGAAGLSTSGINDTGAATISGGLSTTTGVFSGSISGTGATFTTEVAPSITGVQLGDTAHRWDIFVRNIDWSGTFTGGSLVAASLAVTNNATIGGSLTVTGVSSLSSVNNRIYVDGNKYPLTQAGIQQAFTDACAITTGITPGTTVYFPPMNPGGLTGFTITCPLHVIGVGNAKTVLSITGAGPLFTLSPSANFSQNQEWEFEGIEGAVTAGDVFMLNAASFQITRFYLHDNQLISGTANYTVNTTIGGPTSGLQHVIARNWLFGGINYTIGGGGGVNGFDDGLMVIDNTFSDGLANTTACINLNSASGASHWTVMHNWGGCQGGEVVSIGTTQPKILYNQFEQTTGTGSANGAMIDLQGTTYAIDGAEIVGNNLNAHNQATINIRVATASNTHIENNIINLKSGGGGSGITLTAAASLTRAPWNEFILHGGTAITNASATTNFAAQGPDGTAAIPTYAWANYPSTGFYAVAGPVLEMAIGGAPNCIWASFNMRCSSAQTIAWSAGGDPNLAFADVSLSRQGVGILQVGNSDAASANGTIKAALFVGGATLASPTINGTPTGTGISTATLKSGTGAGNYTSASTTYVRPDSTNLAYTVTIPTGWKLMVHASGTALTITAAVQFGIALADGAADNTGILVETLPIASSVTVGIPFALDWVVNGDGASHTLNLQFRTTNGADNVLLANASSTFKPTMTFLLSPSN